MVAAGEISATDAAGKKDVAAVEEVGRFLQEANVAGAVSGDMEDLEINAFDDLGGGFVGEKVGLDWVDFPIETELFKEIGLCDEGGGVRMITDFAFMLALDAGGVPDMVDMAMGEEEGVDGISLIAEPFGGVLRCIHQDAGPRKKEAIRVEDAAGEGVEIHARETSSIEHRTSNTQWRRCVAEPYWMLDVECWMLEVSDPSASRRRGEPKRSISQRK